MTAMSYLSQEPVDLQKNKEDKPSLPEKLGSTSNLQRFCAMWRLARILLVSRLAIA